MRWLVRFFARIRAIWNEPGLWYEPGAADLQNALPDEPDALARLEAARAAAMWRAECLEEGAGVQWRRARMLRKQIERMGG